MSITMSDVGITKPSREVEILDIYGEAIGLTISVRPDTDAEFLKIQRGATDRFASGKKLNKSERRDITDNLFMARVGGWSWEGKALEAVGGKAPQFNAKNLKSVLYQQGEQSAAIRKQIAEAIGDFDDFLPIE